MIFAFSSKHEFESLSFQLIRPNSHSTSAIPLGVELFPLFNACFQLLALSWWEMWNIFKILLFWTILTILNKTAEYETYSAFVIKLWRVIVKIEIYHLWDCSGIQGLFSPWEFLSWWAPVSFSLAHQVDSPRSTTIYHEWHTIKP